MAPKHKRGARGRETRDGESSPSRASLSCAYLELPIIFMRLLRRLTFGCILFFPTSCRVTCAGHNTTMPAKSSGGRHLTSTLLACCQAKAPPSSGRRLILHVRHPENALENLCVQEWEACVRDGRCCHWLGH